MESILLKVTRPEAMVQITNLVRPYLSGTLVSNWYQDPRKGEELNYLEFRSLVEPTLSIDERTTEESKEDHYILHWNVRDDVDDYHLGMIDPKVKELLEVFALKVSDKPVAHSKYPVVMYPGIILLEYEPSWYYKFGEADISYWCSVGSIVRTDDNPDWDWHRAMLHGFPGRQI